MSRRQRHRSFAYRVRRMERRFGAVLRAEMRREPIPYDTAGEARVVALAEAFYERHMPSAPAPQASNPESRR